MQENSWKHLIADKLQDIEQQYLQEKPSSSMLFWAIKQGHLNETKYIQWARTNLFLPLLREQFFSQNSLNKNIIEKYQNTYTWSEEALPIAEWDNGVFIACLEPPQNLPEGQTFIPILASVAHLEKAWQTLRPTSAKSKASDNSEDPFASLELVDDEESHAESANVTEPANLEELEVPGQAPDGLSLNFSPTTLSPLQSSSPPPPAPTQASAPDLDDQQSEKTQVIGSNPVTVTSTNANTNTNQQAGPALLNAIAAKKSQAATGSVIELLWAKNAKHMDEQINLSFSRLKSHFTKVMLQKVQGGMATPIIWDETFTEPEQNKAVHLRDPSIFRLAVHTIKPFHGPVANNAVNQSFFDAWNKKEVPEQVTIVPIEFESTVIALLVGFGPSTSYNKEALQVVESEAQRLLMELNSLHANQAKAA